MVGPCFLFETVKRRIGETGKNLEPGTWNMELQPAAGAGPCFLLRIQNPEYRIQKEGAAPLKTLRGTSHRITEKTFEM